MKNSDFQLDRREAGLSGFSMSRFFKRFAWLSVLVLGFQSAFGFALLGPFNEAWQIPAIGYGLGGDIGGPKNIGEEYRWNTPTNYFAFDASFLDYFGSNGVRAVEQAIDIINALPPASTPGVLDQFPLESQRINPRAEQLQLLDLKSICLQLLVEELGLTYPDRFLWTLRFRETQPGLSCPFMIYGVLHRNFDPVTFQPSSYLNGVLYSYLILEACQGTPTALTFNFPVDPLAQEFLPIMSEFGLFRPGSYATGLSRDDFGGLRYGWRTNNVNWESASSGSLEFVTNYTPQLLFPSNLTLLAAQALTNNAAQLAILYPGLIITSTSNSFGFFQITNVTAYFTNFPWDSGFAALFPHVVFATNVSPLFPQIFFHHTFGNIRVLQPGPNGFVGVPVSNISPFTGQSFVTIQNTLVSFQVPPWSTFPALATNITSRTFVSNGIVGEFFILPTNACDISIIGTLLTNVVFTTNIVATTTNVLTTNVLTGTQSFEQDVITMSTSHILVVYPITCTASNVTLRQGMDKITFVRTSFDSLLGRFFQPITNTYHLIEVTNSVAVTNWFQRIITRPDLLYRADDNAGFNGAEAAFRTVTAGNFNTANEIPGLAGPGNIEPNMIFTLNKAGPLNINFYDPLFVLNGLSESTSITNFIWASYDGSTNAPILYPSGRSITDLENELLFQIVTPDLPDGAVGVPYAAQVQATGGQQPYTWQMAQGSAPLPPGLTLDSSGLIFGTPATAGTFSFTVTVMEAGGRAKSRTLSITINP